MIMTKGAGTRHRPSFATCSGGAFTMASRPREGTSIIIVERMPTTTKNTVIRTWITQFVTTIGRVSAADMTWRCIT